MEFISNIILNPTPFSIIGIASIILGIPLGIKASQAEGFAALMGGLIYLGVFVCIIGLTLDRILINLLPQRLLISVQIALIALAYLIFQYKNKRLLINAKKLQTDYLLLFENDGYQKDSELVYSFPFNRRLKLMGTCSWVKSELMNEDKIKFIPPSAWNDFYSTRSKKISDVQVIFYLRGGLKEQKQEVQEKIRKDIRQFLELESFLDKYKNKWRT